MNRFPNNHEVFEFYKLQYIERHGEYLFIEKIKNIYGFSKAEMCKALMNDYMLYKEIK